MKRFVFYCLLGVLAFSIGAGASPLQTAENQQYTVFTPYEYPIVPGTPEWAALRGNADKINACRVPDELAKQMSTDALLETYLTHPLATNIFAFNTYNGGFNALKGGYDMGLDELIGREDLSDAILRSYSHIRVCTHGAPEGDAETAVFEDMWRMSLLEVLAAETDAASQEQSRPGISLENVIKEKCRKKAKNASLYGPFAGTYYKTLAEKNYVDTLNIVSAQALELSIKCIN